MREGLIKGNHSDLAKEADLTSSPLKTVSRSLIWICQDDPSIFIQVNEHILLKGCYTSVSRSVELYYPCKTTLTDINDSMNKFSY